MTGQYILKGQTEKDRININELDKELIDFSNAPSSYTSSVCYFISVPINTPALQINGGRKRQAALDLLNLLSQLEKSYPPRPDADISGIEEIYRS